MRPEDDPGARFGKTSFAVRIIVSGYLDRANAPAWAFALTYSLPVRKKWRAALGWGW